MNELVRVEYRYDDDGQPHPIVVGDDSLNDELYDAEWREWTINK